MHEAVKRLVDAYTTQLVQSGRVKEADAFKLSVDVLSESDQTEEAVLRIMWKHDQGLAM